MSSGDSTDSSSTTRKRSRGAHAASSGSGAALSDADVAAAERALLDQLAALEYSNSSLRRQVCVYGVAFHAIRGRERGRRGPSGGARKQRGSKFGQTA